MIAAAFITGAYCGAIGMGLVSLAAVTALQWAKRRDKRKRAIPPAPVLLQEEQP